MQISSGFTLLLIIVTSVLSITVYSFCRGAVSHTPRIQNRKLNKLESLILIPLAAFYHFFVIKLVTEVFFNGKIFCFFSKPFEFSVGHNDLFDYLLSFYPNLNTCVELAPLHFSIGLLVYYLIVVLLIPYVIGKFLYRETWFQSSYDHFLLVIQSYRFFLKLSILRATVPVLIFGLVLYFAYHFHSQSIWKITVSTSAIVVMAVKPMREFFIVPLFAFIVFLGVFLKLLIELVFFLILAVVYLPLSPFFKILREWIISSDIPEYLKDFKDSDFYYIADVTLTDGKMVTGIVRDFEYRGDQKKLESIILEKPIRWERFVKTEKHTDIWQKEIISEGYYVKEKSIPGESFYIRTDSIVDINTTKVPRNFIYIFSSSSPNVPAAFISEFEKWFKENHKKYIFTNLDLYIPSIMTENKQVIRDLFPEKKLLLGRIELFSVENKDFMNFLEKTIFRKPKSKKLIIECDLDKNTISSPYFDAKNPVFSGFKKTLLGIKDNK